MTRSISLKLSVWQDLTIDGIILKTRKNEHVQSCPFQYYERQVPLKLWGHRRLHKILLAHAATTADHFKETGGGLSPVVKKSEIDYSYGSDKLLLRLSRQAHLK